MTVAQAMEGKNVYVSTSEILSTIADIIMLQLFSSSAAVCSNNSCSGPNKACFLPEQCGCVSGWTGDNCQRGKLYLPCNAQHNTAHTCNPIRPGNLLYAS